jgi:Restriction endonuclease
MDFFIITLVIIGVVLYWSSQNEKANENKNRLEQVRKQREQDDLVRAKEELKRTEEVYKKKNILEQERYIAYKDSLNKKVSVQQDGLLRAQGEAKRAEEEFKEKSLEAQRKYKESEDALDKIQIAQKQLEHKESIFNASLSKGRLWLAEMIAEADVASDAALYKHLLSKKIPAPAAAENVKNISKEKRAWIIKAKDYEYQIKQLEEFFPKLKDYKEAIQEELISHLDESDETDPILRFLSVEEWNVLPVEQREDLAIERYLNGASRSAWDAGLKYERYLGSLYEKDGWFVEYIGALNGLEDYGRDLICSKNNVVRVIQAKRWKENSPLYMKHVVQIFGTTLLLQQERSLLETPTPMLVSTSAFAEDSKKAAQALNVKLVVMPLDKNYACIKVHKSRNGEAIYHLPFDQQYDRIKMDVNKGDAFVKSVKDALKMGARRAQKYQFQNQ